MVNETPEQRIWKLEQGQKNIMDAVSRLEHAVTGNGQPGLKEQLNDIKREMRSLVTFGDTMNSLERTTVRQAEHKALEGRVDKLEEDKVKNEGMKLGRAGLWAGIAFVITVLGGVAALLIQVSNLSSRIVGGP